MPASPHIDRVRSAPDAHPWCAKIPAAHTTGWLLVAAALLAGCGAFGGDGDPDATTEGGVSPGCRAGNRAQCVAQVALGAHFACALMADRTVWCWGRNDQSQLGYATTDVCVDELGGGRTRSVACHTFPFQVTGLERVTAIAAGDAHACALREDGSVACWGAGAAGQLGAGGTLPSTRPQRVSGLTGATAIALGARHSCAIGARGAVWCWGADDRLQLGAAASGGSCDDAGARIACAVAPVAVAGLTDVVELAAGDAHTCARTRDGRALCWGDNRAGQLGTGRASADPVAAPQPVTVGSPGSPLRGVRAIASGAEHACALREDGGVVCWGRDDDGALGQAACAGGCDGAGTCVAAAVDVDLDAPLASDAGAACGGDDASVPRDGGAAPRASDASVTTRADAGATDAAAASDAGRAPANGAGATAVAAGGAFACARLMDGTARCWGSDGAGQLGDGDTSDTPQPPSMVIAAPGAAPSNPLQDVTALAAGRDTACALLADGSLRCWGSNQDGALGIGTTSARHGPVPVSW